MEVVNRTFQPFNKDLGVSIVKFSEDYFEIAVMYRVCGDKWDIDESIYQDPLQAHSEMEVYGIIEHKIKPEYF